MKIPAQIIACALLATTPLFARDKSDVLVMNNGDHLTCEIKGLDASVLYVSFDYIKGTTSVDWSKVRHVESKQLFLVKTQDGSVYTGMLSTADAGGARPARIEVTGNADVEPLLAAIQRQFQLRADLLQRESVDAIQSWDTSPISRGAVGRRRVIRFSTGKKHRG
jgi:hypothetical protein